MKYLVTGGAGFIGSHLVDLLISKGHEVVCLDNLSTGRMENIQHNLANDNFSFCDADISILQEDEPNFLGVDVVFHLAGLADIVPSIEDPISYTNANVLGTANVMQACRYAGVRSVVYAASSSCYGIPTEFPTTEDALIEPQYPYALTKRLGEEVVFHWGSTYGIATTSLRLFNVYGPRSRTSGAYGAVFGVFLSQLVNGRPLTIVGDGKQSRDFTFVTDVAKAFFAAANRTGSKPEVYNVGSGGHYAINYLADLLGGDRVYLPKRPGEPDCTFAAVSKIKEELGWSAEVGFEAGVRIMIEQSESWLNAPIWDEDTIQEATKSWFKYLGDEK